MEKDEWEVMRSEMLPVYGDIHYLDNYTPKYSMHFRSQQCHRLM